MDKWPQHWLNRHSLRSPSVIEQFHTTPGWNAQAFGRVGVLMGGTSAEREVSLSSGAMVLEACRALGLNVIALDLGSAPITQLIDANIDWAFNIIHGGYGENGELEAALALLGIHSTASSATSMALAMNKHFTKSLWRQAGLPTPNWHLLRASHCTASNHKQRIDVAKSLLFEKKLSLPLVIKPANEGSSVGLFIVHSNKELETALATTLSQFEHILVEELIQGVEITMGLVADRALPVIEIQAPNGVYDYHAKYQSSATRMLIPTSLGHNTEAQAQTLARQAFDCLGCSVWGRVDAIVDSAGTIQLLEINTLPGMTGHSLVPYASAHEGRDFAQLVQTIFSAAVHTTNSPTA